MPLSSNGLWEADSTTPPWASRRRVRNAMAGRGQHADRVDVGAGGQRAGHERALEHGARTAACPARRPAGLLDAVVLEQRGHELPPEAEGQLGGQGRLVGDAADAVGAEQPAHRAGPSEARGGRGEGFDPQPRVTPGGTVICSGSTRIVTSPARRRPGSAGPDPVAAETRDACRAGRGAARPRSRAARPSTSSPAGHVVELDAARPGSGRTSRSVITKSPEDHARRRGRAA